MLYRDVLGLQRVDWQKKEVEFRFTDPGLEWCDGQVPTPHGLVKVRWKKEAGKLVYSVDLPAGYNLKVENRSSLQAIPAR